MADQIFLMEKMPMGSLSEFQILRAGARRRANIARVLFALVLTIFLVAGSEERAFAATYSGKVVDAETEQPLEGAVIVLVWHKKAFFSMNGGWSFHNARETVADAEGNFSMDASEGINFNPFAWVDTPRIAVYHPGYWPLSDAYPREFRDLYGIEDAMKKGAVVKLPKLKTKEEVMKFVGVTVVMAPYEKIPNLIRAINRQRATVGLKPIY